MTPMSDFAPAAEVAATRGTLDRLKANMRQTIKGKDNVIEQTLVCLLANGHLLIEDLPGVGKTTLAYSLARSMDCAFSRIQFTSDLLPSDVTGVSIYDEAVKEFVFKSGPVFANVVLADEINRATPKTQSALLEVMDRGRVTIDGGEHRGEKAGRVLRRGRKQVRLVVNKADLPGADQEDARELALRARGGLERDAVHADDLGQASLEAPHQLERALHRAVLAVAAVQRDEDTRVALVLQLVQAALRGVEGVRVDADRLQRRAKRPRAPEQQRRPDAGDRVPAREDHQRHGHQDPTKQPCHAHGPLPGSRLSRRGGSVTARCASSESGRS